MVLVTYVYNVLALSFQNLPTILSLTFFFVVLQFMYSTTSSFFDTLLYESCLQISSLPLTGASSFTAYTPVIVTVSALVRIYFYDELFNWFLGCLRFFLISMDTSCWALLIFNTPDKNWLYSNDKKY